MAILSGKTYTITLPRQKNDDKPLKVSDVKELIAKQAKIPSQIQELFYEGRSLKDDEASKGLNTSLPQILTF